MDRKNDNGPRGRDTTPDDRRDNNADRKSPPDSDAGLRSQRESVEQQPQSPGEPASGE